MKNRFELLRKKQIGLAPGSLIYLGEESKQDTVIKIINYNDNICIESRIDKIEDIEISNDKFFWIDVLGLTNIEKIEKLGEKLNINKLILEDVVNTEYKPKISYIDDTVFCVMKLLQYNDTSKEISVEHISIVAKKKFLITFQEIEDDSFIMILNRLQKSNSRLRKRGIDYLFYAILNLLLENQAKTLYQFGYAIEELSEVLLINTDVIYYHELIKYKKILVQLKKTIRPVEEIIFELAGFEHEFFSDENEIYLNDLKDHSKQVIKTLEEVNDSLNLAYDTYVASLNIKMNEVIKTLTIISTIFIPLSFVAGIYGMNFKFMPELDWRIGYPFALLIMSSIGGGFLYYFKKRKWF